MASRTVLMGSCADTTETIPASQACAIVSGVSLRVISTTRSGLERGRGVRVKGCFVQYQDAIPRRVRPIDGFDMPGAGSRKRFPNGGRVGAVGNRELNRLHHGPFPHLPGTYFFGGT